MKRTNEILTAESILKKRTQEMQPFIAQNMFTNWAKQYYDLQMTFLDIMPFYHSMQGFMRDAKVEHNMAFYSTASRHCLTVIEGLKVLAARERARLKEEGVLKDANIHIAGCED